MTKACGPDLISPRLLKEGANILSKPLSIIFNRSLLQGNFPSKWKDASATAIYKKSRQINAIKLQTNISSKSNRENYGKMYPQTSLQLHILHLFSLVLFNAPLQPSNFYTHTISFIGAVDSGKEVRVVSCDISKAFNSVWHRGLLHKLAGVGLSEGLLCWFKSYLSHRRQRVVLNGVESNLADVLAGVPQGSLLGPLLFLVYTEQK